MFITSTIEWSPLYFWSALIILLTTWYWTWTQSRFVRLINAIPGPKHLPLLGNLLDLGFSYDGKLQHLPFFYTVSITKTCTIFVSGLFRKLTFDWNKKYGGIFRVWLTFHPVVVVGLPEMLEVRFK